MAPPPLPQEIIDKIIDQFSETARRAESRASNKRALVPLSMVARAWRERSQKHLFSVMKFRVPLPLDITEADLDELGPVFSLTGDLNIDGHFRTLSQFNPAIIAFLRCFRNLKSLSFSNWRLRQLDPRLVSTCLSHLGETVVHLRLEGGVSTGSLIYLASTFPRLRVLKIFITTDCDEEPGDIVSEEELPIVGCFQGCLSLFGLTEQHNAFLLFLSSTSPKFDKIYIHTCSVGDGLGKLLDSSAPSLESLELHAEGNNPEGNPASLSKCVQLREVCISHMWSKSIPSLLQTIRSPHLKKFMVYFKNWAYGNLDRVEYINTLMEADGELRKAYDQWTKHVTGTVEVIFYMPGEENDSLGRHQFFLKRAFPQLTEKVAVTIVAGGEVQ